MEVDRNTATPDVSPFIIRKTEKIKFKFQDFMSAAMESDDLDLGSPNLSPIK